MEKTRGKGMHKALRNTILGTAAGLLTLGAAGGVYEATNNFPDIPALHQTAEGTPFDINKLDTQHQAIIFGNNTQEATNQNIVNLINSTVPDPKSVEDVPTISVIPSIDLQKAGKVEIWRSMTAFKPIPANLHFSLAKSGSLFGLILGGTHAENAEVFRMSNNMYIEKFDLGNNRYMLLTVNSANLVLIDAVKDAPTINADNFIQEATTKGGLEFNTNNSSIFVTTKDNTEITTFVSYINGPQGFFEPIVPAVENGNVLISTPR